MKFRIMLFIITAFLSIPAFSQERPDMLTFYGGAGLSGGSAISMTGPSAGYVYGGGIYAYQSPEVEASAGYQFGVTYDLILVAGLAITPGISYAHKPFKLVYKKNTASSDLVWEMKADYLEIPVALRYQWNYFFLGAGGYYGIKIRSETTCSNSSVDTSKGKTGNDYGILFDFGAKINVSESSSIVIMTRWEFGIAKVYKDNTSLVREVKNDDFQLNLGYALKI